MAEQSILTSIKKVLGIDEGYTNFDVDIILHTNSVFSTLQQLGVGPVNGFIIEDKEANWTDFTNSEKSINSVKSYVYLRVRILFDPPTTSFALDAMDKQAKEMEWRLNVAAETVLPNFSPGPVSGQASIWDLTGGLDFPDEAPVNAVGIDLITGNVWRKS